MEKTFYAVHGFQAGCRQKEVFFEDEHEARSYAAYLGSSLDCVSLAKRVVRTDPKPRWSTFDPVDTRRSCRDAE
jgi:hypothetical protein